MESAKKKKIIMIVAAVFAALVIAFTLILFLGSTYTAIVYDTNSKYFKAGILFMFNKNMLCLRDPQDHDRRKTALEAEESGRSLSLISLEDVSSIEIIPDSGEESGAYDGDLQIRYLGKFKVDVSGNEGYLFLRKSGGKIKGIIRFPNWANGVNEPLKSLWISKGKIGFIRSVDSPREANYVGTSTYFIQEYYGEYKRKGNMIEGFYTSRGTKNQWSAYRVK